MFRPEAASSALPVESHDSEHFLLRSLSMHRPLLAGRVGFHPPTLLQPDRNLEGRMNMQSNLPATATTVPATGEKTAAIGQTLLAALLGVFLIWGVGFSHSSAFHNAAHDTRHSNAFPCH
jgi:cobalt transporter subunit CbtB